MITHRLDLRIRWCPHPSSLVMPCISWERVPCLSVRFTVALSRRRAPTSKPIPTTTRCTSIPMRPSAHSSAACRYAVDPGRYATCVHEVSGLGQESLHFRAARELPDERPEAGHPPSASECDSVSIPISTLGPAFTPKRSFHFDTAAGGGAVQPCEAAYLGTLDTTHGGDATPPAVTVLVL